MLKQEIHICINICTRVHYVTAALLVCPVFNTPPPTSLSFLPGLYPNLEELGDYMGLALNSDEVQRNLALLPVADSVSVRDGAGKQQKVGMHYQSARPALQCTPDVIRLTMVTSERG